MAIHLYTYVNPVRIKDIEEICRVLSDGGVIALALDAGWSFVCDAAHSKALERIQRLKPSHPKDRPFSLMCHSISMASHIANIDNAVYPWLKKALPGPYTILLERHVSLPKQIHDKRREVGLRIPDCELALEILKSYGKPLAASTVPSEDDAGLLPGFGWEVDQRFGHGLDMVVDRGDETLRAETTIIDLTSGTPVLIRQGLGDPSRFGLDHR